MIWLLLSCCFSDRDSNKEFVKKHKDENFDAFINTSFLIRSIDEKGNLIVFVSTDFENAYNEGPYIMTVEKGTGRIIDTSFRLRKDSINFKKDDINSLVLKFLEYNVYSLAVDKSGNVYFRLREAEKPTLIRFSDSNRMNEEYRKNWRKIEGNWYEKRNN